MRVGIFTDTYRPIRTGVVHAVDLMRRGLEDLGHEVHIFAPVARGHQDGDARVYRFPAINLSRKVASPLAIPVFPPVLAMIPGLGLDIVHTQHPFPVGRLGVRLARRLGIPAVYTFHTQYEQYAHYVPLPGGLVRAGARRLVFEHAQRCDLIICPTPSSRDLLVSYGVTRPMEILPNAIDLTAFEQAHAGDVRARLGIGPQERVLLYCGRLAREKNLPFMLQALGDTLRRAPGIRLVMVGDGTERETLQRLAADLGLDQRVLFPGSVPYGDVPRYYAAADLFVMTSLTEVMPLALLEAMASGLPVVAVAGPGLSDVVTDGLNGILTAHDPGAFAGAVQRALASDAAREEMGANARAAIAQYGVGRTVHRLVAIYEMARAGRRVPD